MRRTSSSCGQFGLSLRMNLRRAGVLKRSTASTVVPTRWAAGFDGDAHPTPLPPGPARPRSASVREVKVRRETELMEASASRESPGCWILPDRPGSPPEVGVRDSASTSSSLATPQPLSRMRISLAPPLSMSISVGPLHPGCFPSSFTTEEGPLHHLTGSNLVGQNRRQYTDWRRLLPQVKRARWTWRHQRSPPLARQTKGGVLQPAHHFRGI